MPDSTIIIAQHCSVVHFKLLCDCHRIHCSTKNTNWTKLSFAINPISPPTGHRSCSGSVQSLSTLEAKENPELPPKRVLRHRMDSAVSNGYQRPSSVYWLHSYICRVLHVTSYNADSEMPHETDAVFWQQTTTSQHFTLDVLGISDQINCNCPWWPAGGPIPSLTPNIFRIYENQSLIFLLVSAPCY